MRVLVTGAAGFVGGHLIEELKKDKENEIFALVLNEKEREQVSLEDKYVYMVDITDDKAVNDAVFRICPDIVFHLAAQSSVGLSWKLPALTYEVNIVGTTNLLEALVRHSQEARVLLIGSAEQYGQISSDGQAVSESHPLHAENPYAISKMAQERIADLYVRNSRLHIMLVRAFNHIGAGQDTKFVVPDWCSQVIEMEQDCTKEGCLRVGNVAVRRDFTDVRDIVRAYTLLSKSGEKGGIYNVGSGEAHSLEEILGLIIKNSNREGITWEKDESKFRPNDIMELRADITKLVNTIDWKPEIKLEQSVAWIMEEMRAERNK